MADSFVQLNPDGTGKKIDTRTESVNNDHRQVMVIGDPSANAGVAPVDAVRGLAVDLSSSGPLPAGTNVIGHTVVDSGTLTANQGTPAIAANKWPIEIVDASGTNIATVTAANAVKVDGSAVIQPVSGTLTTTPPANASTNVTQLNGNTILTGSGTTGTGSARVTVATDNPSLPNWGQGSTGSAVPSGALYEAGLATTALPTASSSGNLTGLMADKFGRQVIVLGTVRDLRAGQTTTISASTTETTIITAGASGIFNDLIQIVVANTSPSTDTRIDFRDATSSSVIFSLQSSANSTIGFNVPGTSIPQTASANNWTAQCAVGTTDIRIYALYEKNK